MKCKYTIKVNKKSEGENLSFSELTKVIENYISDTYEDYVYSLGGEKAEISSKLIKDKVDAIATLSTNGRDTEFEFGTDYISPQQLVNSSAWAVNGVKANVRLSDSDFLTNKIKAYQKEGYSLEEATAKANDEKLHWNTINLDGFDLHQLINSFKWGTSEDNITNWITHLNGTKFLPIASILYSKLKNEVSLLLFDTFKMSSEKVSIVRNVNLKAKVPGMDKEVLAHYDNIVIDENGNLHIFQYKYTASPLHEWSSNKIETYKHEMAVLKQVLAANGYDTDKCTLHLIPIQANYNADFTGISEIEVHTKSDIPGLSFDVTMKNGVYNFHSYDRVSRQVIPSASIKSKEDPESIINIEKNLDCIMDKDVQLGADGIHFSADEWIAVNYNSKTLDRIKKIDGGYEVYLNPDYSNPTIIHDTTEPKNNEQIKELLYENLSELENSNRNAMNRIYDACALAFLKKRSFIESLSLGNIQKELNHLLLPYLKVREVGDEKIQDWELIENDTLKQAGILCLWNKSTNQVDTICLSARNLRTIIKRKGLTNILSHYIKDIDSGILINVKNSEENIQAIRAAVVLNEVYDSLPNKNSLRFGDIKIFSRVGGGQISIQPMEKVVNTVLPAVCKVVKGFNKEFKFVNKFKSTSCIDPVALLYEEYKYLIGNNSLSSLVRLLLQDLLIEHLESETSKELKRKHLIEIASKIEEILKEKYLPRTDYDSIKNCANGNGSPQAQALCALFIKVLEALLSLSRYTVDNEYKLNWALEYMPTQNAVANPTFRGAVNVFVRAVDEIADLTSHSLTTGVQGCSPFTTAISSFYKASGITTLNTKVYGDLVKFFLNLYKRNEKNEIMMLFKNPFSDDFENRLLTHEKKFLKEVLYRINRTRCLIHGIPFDFKGPDDPDFALFIKEKPFALNVPLKKARKATERVNGTLVDRFKKKFTNTKKAILNRVSSLSVTSEKESQQDIYDWNLSGQFTESDGFGTNLDARNRILNKYPIDYWETDLESLVVDFEEDYFRTKELNKALIEIKAILMHLEAMGNYVGKKDGLEQTINMIHKFVKANFFEKSLLEPEMQEFLDKWVMPLKHLVSRAYIAGNIVSMFRDTIEGVLQSYTRAVVKFNCKISAGNVTKAYKEVILNMCTDTKSLNKLDQLCKLYRLSNSDISRISEGMKSNTGGLSNYENWMYATLRKPDFLNRMVLFVARCMEDGTWDAFSINEKTGEVKYDWKKDKRFKAYAENSSNKTEYEKAKEAYYNAIMDYNEAHNTHITPSEGLPTAYTPQQIESIRELSNNIFGSYDKALRSGFERTAGGIIFGSFTTWMNGMWNNYTRMPGIYDEYTDKVEQETDINGNKVFAYQNESGDLIKVIEVENEDGSKRYIEQDSLEEYKGDISKLKRRMAYVPDVVQGIWYTLTNAKDVIVNAKSANEAFSNFKSEIWNNPKQRKNLEKLFSDLIMALLLGLLFKMAITPAYNDFKKHPKEHGAVEAGLTYLMYNSSSRSFDGFLGPVNVLTHIGNNSNPPFYQLPVKIADDLGNALFGNKTWDSVMTGNVAIFKSFQGAINAYKAQQ